LMAIEHRPMANKTQKDPLALLLGSTARAQILTHLFQRTSPAQGIRETAALAGIDYKSARRELLLLESLGVVSSRREGNRRIFHLNRRHPALEDLRGLVQKVSGHGIIRILRDEMEGVEALEAAVLYGSLARGEEEAESDVDLLLIGEMEDEEILPVAARLERILGREVQFVLYAPTEFRRLVDEGNAFVAGVLAGEKVVLKGEEVLGR